MSRSELACLQRPRHRQSPEIYSRLALADAQKRYDDVIGNFPVWPARSHSLRLVTLPHQHPTWAYQVRRVALGHGEAPGR